MIPIIQHSGKDKKMEEVKKSVLLRCWRGKEGRTGRAQRNLGAVNYSVSFYNGVYISL